MRYGSQRLGDRVLATSPPSHHALAGAIGAYERWSRESDRSAATAPGRAAFNDRFAREVDPTNTLPPAERAIRAGYARRAYFLRLALKSAQARRRGKVVGDDA